MTQAATATRTHTPTRPAPLWNVILHDDDQHTYAYVMEMMQSVFGHPPEEGFRIAERVDRDGRAICTTTHLELAELKRDQVHAYGKDRAIASCKGSMTASLEPCEGGHEDGRGGRPPG